MLNDSHCEAINNIFKQSEEYLGICLVFLYHIFGLEGFLNVFS